MAIQVSGTQVIGNSRELTNIASVDATTAASITAAGVGGGGTVDLTADGSISSGNVVGISGNGTVSTTAALFGPTTAYSSSGNRAYSSSYWDQATNKVVVASADVGATTIKIRVGTIASNGAISWGTEASYSGYTGLNYMCCAMHNNVGVVTFYTGTFGIYRMMRSFGVSGTTVNATSGNEYMDGSNPYSYIGTTGVQTLMADPNNSGKFIQCYSAENSLYPYVALISATGTTATSVKYKVTANQNNVDKSAIAYNPTSGKFMGTWSDTSNKTTAASLTVSGNSISIGTVLTSTLTGSADTNSIAYSSTTGNFLHFTRDGGSLYGFTIYTNSSGNVTSFGSRNLVVTGSGSDFFVRYTYNSSGSTTIAGWEMGSGATSKMHIITDTASGIIATDGESLDISDTASTSGNYGGPWGLQDKGTFISFNGNASPYNSSEINTGSTYFSALGVSEGSYTNGQTATITITGGITNTISGLTTGEFYQPSSSTVGGLAVGGSFALALNTNQLLVK